MKAQKLIFNDKVFVFETMMRVRNTELNSSHHLSLEALTVLLAEARARFFYFKKIEQFNTSHQGLVINELQLNIVSPVDVREALLFEVGVEQLADDSGTIAFKVTRMHDGSIIATARQHFVNYDYQSKNSLCSVLA